MPQSFLYAIPGALSIVVNHRALTFCTATGGEFLRALPDIIEAAHAGRVARWKFGEIEVVTDDGVVCLDKPGAGRVALLGVESAQALQNCLPRYIRLADQLERDPSILLVPIH